MSGLNFELYQTAMDTAYVQLQVGKGKKNQPSVYIDSNVFDFIKGVIWNKHREYQSNDRKINQINNEDWRRILSGFEEALEELTASTSSNQLMKILSIPNHTTIQVDLVFEQKQAFQQFLKDLILWIKTHLKKEKYILIIQSNL